MLNNFRVCLYFLIIFLLPASFAGAKQNPKAASLDFEKVAVFPTELETAELSCGISGDALIVSDSRSLAVLDKNEQEETFQWLTDLSVSAVNRDAVWVRDDEGVILLGGIKAGKCSRDVYKLIWDKASKKLITTEGYSDQQYKKHGFKKLPDLPYPLAKAGGVKLDDVIYLFGGVKQTGGKAVSSGLSLDLSQEHLKWKQLPRWDGEGVAEPMVAVQTDGVKNCIYIAGGYAFSDGRRKFVNKCRSFDPKEYKRAHNSARMWRRLADIPKGVELDLGTFVKGQSHIFMFGTRGGVRLLYAYHTITNSWVKLIDGIQLSDLKRLAADDDKVFVLAETSDGTEDNTLCVYKSSLQVTKRQFSRLDYIAMAVYLIIICYMGVYFSGKEKSTNDFFLAGGRIPAWAAALSIFATGFSAISFLTIPAKAYSENWAFFMGNLLQPLLAVFFIFLFIPFYRKLNVTTAYEYLERRFNLPVRLYAGMVFIFAQLARLGVVLYLPALALSTVTGLNLYLCIAIMGSICIFYTVLGGMEAVIWTDVMQTVIIVVGLIFCMVIILLSINGGVGEIFSVGAAHEKFNIGRWRGDWTTKAVWVLIVGNAFWYLAGGANQNAAQRFMSVKDEKEARKTAWLTAAMSMILGGFMFLIGTMLFVYYKKNPAELNFETTNDGIMPWFIVQEMPVVVTGVIIAAIFASSMSSFDSSMHSGATVWINDFYRRLKHNISDKKHLLMSKIAAFAIGAFGLCFALLMAYFGDRLTSILEFIWQANALLQAGLGGIFIAGIFSKRTHGVGVFIGALAGAAALFYVKTYTQTSFFLYYAIGMTTCIVVGYLASLLIPHKHKNINGLTIYTVKEKVE